MILNEIDGVETYCLVLSPGPGPDLGLGLDHALCLDHELLIFVRNLGHCGPVMVDYFLFLCHDIY